MLEIGNLEVVYHKVLLVLRGVSLTVPEGAIVALLGANGAGKTTLMRAITGLLPIQNGQVTKGRIRWDGKDITRERADAIVRSGVAQVMEGRRILAELTVEENLRAGAYTARGVDVREAIAASYERFPVLGHYRDKHAGYLSGGEQQMLAIARALMSRPRLMLFDEPSLGLAPKLVEEVAGLIRQIHAEGVTILLVEQNAAMALSLASYGYVMDNGKIVLDAPSAELLADRDIREFYLGHRTDSDGDASQSYRDVKRYRRRKRWLS